MIRLRAAVWAGALAILASVGCDGDTSEARRVLFVTLDTTRADHLGFYGYEEAETPNMDRAASRGAVFEQAVSQVPTTLPSHSTMFTGLYPPEHGVRYNLVYKLGPEAVTLAEVLRDEEFATAAFPASFIVSSRFGIDQGFDTWDEPKGSEDFKGPDQAFQRDAKSGVDRALTWMQGREDERQFVWLHFYDPHLPYKLPFPYSDRFRDRPYDGEIAFVDAQLGRIFEWLDDTGGWDETLLVVVGDHGEGLFDHGTRTHSFLVYDSTQHVPLFFRGPGIDRTRVDEPVGLADLMPTILELLEIETELKFGGTSLVPALHGGSIPQREIYAETLAGSLNYGWQELRSLRDGRYKLIDSDRPELFDLANDPGERDDLASLEPGRVQEMQARLAEFLESMEGDVASAEQTPIGLTAAERALLASLGYTEGSGGSAENATHPQDVVFLAEDLVAGAEMLKAGNYEQGKELAEYVLGLDPANKWALQHLSNAFASEGKFQEAQDVAKEFMDRYPDADQSYINFGHILKARGDDASTLAHFRNARERFPDSEWIAYYELLAGFDNDLPEVCEAMIRKAIDDFPTFSPITVMLARCSARNGDPDQAVSLLRIAVANGYASMSLVEASADFADTLRSEAWRSWREEVDGKLNALQ